MRWEVYEAYFKAETENGKVMPKAESWKMAGKLVVAVLSSSSAGKAWLTCYGATRTKTWRHR